MPSIMATFVSYTYFRTNPQGTRAWLNHRNYSENSVKVGGKLRLTAHEHNYLHTYERMYECSPSFAFPVSLDALAPCYISQFQSKMASLQNAARQKFVSRMRKHNASLGVSLASWNQSRKMITSRSAMIADMFGDTVRFISQKSSRERRRMGLKGTANAVLEGMFGWVPLIQDIQQGFGALARDAPSDWISASQTGQDRYSQRQTGSAYAYDSDTLWESKLKVSISAGVTVSNPNLWLANRLGLINLPGVAWDLVPWSFVVNMFSNCGAMVNSITDFVGVTTSNESTTYSAKSTRNVVNFAGKAPGQFPTQGSSRTYTEETYRERFLGGIPAPTFEMKVPQLDFGLAAISWSLIGQRIDKINNLISPKGFR